MVTLGLPETQIAIVARLIAVIGVAILSFIADIVVKRFLLSALGRISRRTRTDWDDALVQRRVFHRLSHLAPAIVIWAAAPLVFDDSRRLLNLTRHVVDIYMLFVALLIVNAALNAVNDIYLRYPVSHRIPILVEYLRHHPKVHQEMTFLVRQLQPTETGLPIEIYVFSNDQAWGNYEAIQADIFDHVFACLSEFDLRPFQSPTGQDIVQGVAGLSMQGQPS